MATVEERLAKVERDLEAIKREKLAETSKLGWLERVRGTFKGDPDFAEILRFGREERQADVLNGE